MTPNMGGRTAWAMGAALLLAACGSGGEKSDNAPAVGNSDAAVPGLAEATLKSQTGKCDGLPPFVKTYANARIEGCFSGQGQTPGHESGTVIYTAPAPAATIKAWYKSIAKAEGMADNIDTDTPNPTYSARDGTKKSFMMMTAPEGSGTKVTLNWGRDL